MAKKKKEKQKVVYYDDNSTIADMTNVTRDGKPREKKIQPLHQSTWKEKLGTFWNTFKLMLIPTAIALIILGLLYALLMLLFN
jgi:Flp pilus assembly protein TadB